MEQKYHNWHKKFFKGLWLEVQTKMYSEAQTIEQTKFIIDVLKLKKKEKILDVPCGNGRISNVLSRKGFEVTGVDNNEYLLGLAKKKCRKNKIHPKFIRKEMYDIDFENEFDAVVCFWGSLGFFEDELNFKFLSRVFKALKPHGKFLVDAHILETLLPRIQKHGWLRTGKTENIFVLEDREYDHESSRINVKWTFIKNGKIEDKFTSIRLYSYQELVSLLKNIGFKKFTAYDSMKKTEFKVSNLGRLYLIAGK